MRLTPTPPAADMGFQIAPMIDVVFVILVFFMAMAAQLKVESLLRTRLPGVAVAAGPTPLTDEPWIRIESDGAVSLNDERMEGPESRTLPRLTATLRRLKESADAAQARLVVTLASHPDTPYQRSIDVLDALARAGVVQVSFSAEESEVEAVP